MLEMSLDIAEAIIGREVADRDVVVESIGRCLRFDRPDGDVTLRVHPDDVACAAEAMHAGLIVAPDVELYPDATVERGGCVVDAGAIRIDGQFGPALARVREALALG